MHYYDFNDAISWINDHEKKASLIINGIERIYYKSKQGFIICIPNNKDHLAYIVKEFHLDAILSKDWILLDEGN